MLPEAGLGATLATAALAAAAATGPARAQGVTEVEIAPRTVTSGWRPRLFLVPVGGGAPTEVPRPGDDDRFATPSIRP